MGSISYAGRAILAYSAWLLSPVPVNSQTTVSPLSIIPISISFKTPATDGAEDTSTNNPSCDASLFDTSSVSLSFTTSAIPFVFCKASNASLPFGGAPTASPSATVSGDFTGRIYDLPCLCALDIGAHPSA